MEGTKTPVKVVTVNQETGTLYFTPAFSGRPFSADPQALLLNDRRKFYVELLIGYYEQSLLEPERGVADLSLS